MANAEDKLRAEAIIDKQLEQGRRILESDPKAPRLRISPAALEQAELFFTANQLGVGPKPEGATPRGIADLVDAGVLERRGHARGTKYVLLRRPADLIADRSVTPKRGGKRRRRVVHPTAPRTSNGGVLQIGSSEKTYIREHAREYLAFATGAQARLHEERRQSADILDVINARAKEILKASRSGDGPRLTPLDANRQAQAEVAMDFETLLQVKWNPILFDLFGYSETTDTSMREMRLHGAARRNDEE